MPQALLLTQCLQNDFVKPVARHERLPNLLHIGYEEALRLMGDNPAEGPVARVMQWAYAQPDEALKLIHIRDWHDAMDLRQMGCEYVQSFMFGAPVPGDAALRLLKEQYPLTQA